jgi:hypothetical protein
MSKSEIKLSGAELSEMKRQAAFARWGNDPDRQKNTSRLVQVRLSDEAFAAYMALSTTERGKIIHDALEVEW